MSGHLAWVGGDEWEILDDRGGSIHGACGERVPFGDDARADHVCPDVRANDLANAIADQEFARIECGCDGGVVRERHPLYGSPSCPEPYIERTCPECGGTGEVR